MTDSLLTHDHADVGDLFDELDTALGGGDVARAFELLDLVWARLAVHIRAEHLCLFPAVLSAPERQFTGDGQVPRFDEAQNEVNALKRDHDFFMRELASAVNRMRRTKSSKDAKAVGETMKDVRRTIAAVRERLDRHNESEEQKVYRWVGLLLDEEARADLHARLVRELENAPPRFASGFTSTSGGSE